MKLITMSKYLAAAALHRGVLYRIRCYGRDNCKLDF